MRWWPLGRERREPAAGAAPVAPLIISSAEPDGAWRDLPALQRTLSDSLRPIAVNDDFRNSLTSYADPSFVAPLAHQIDPEAGGLVEGLVSPGVPYARAGGPELAVPPRPEPTVSRKASPATGAVVLSSSKGSGLIDAPPVQRSVISTSAADLATVSLELPEIVSPIPDPELESADPVNSSPSFAASPAGTAKPAAKLAHIPASRPVHEASVGDLGSDAPAPATPARELPVVARSVDRSVETKLPRPARDSSSTPPEPAFGPAATSTELPVVSRAAEPAAESAPLSGFAEAISRLNAPSDTPTDSGAAAISDDHPAGHDDHHAPAASISVQRLSTHEQSLDHEAELPVVAPSAPPSAPPSAAADSSLPAISHQTEAGSSAAEETRPSAIEARSDVPTLGVRLAQAPLTLRRVPMTEGSSAPNEPVQRVEFMTPQSIPAPRPNLGSVASPQVQHVVPSQESTPSTPPSATAPPATPSALQRLPSQDGKRVSNPAIGPSLAVSRRETQVPPAVSDAHVQRLESLKPTAAATPATGSEQGPRPANSVELTTTDVRPLAAGMPIQRTAAARTGSLAEMPTVPPGLEVPIGPAVLAEPWTPTPEPALTQPQLSHPYISPPPAPDSAAPKYLEPARHTPLPMVSRLSAAAPTYPASRSAAPIPTLTVGPSIARLSSDTAPMHSEPASAMSFTSMFGSPDDTESGSSGEDGFTTVQLQSAGEPAPAATEPAADTSSSATPSSSSAAPPPAVGAKPPDLDELARRLYEPLTARLRAELWLDRERAGVMSDG
jgi:hypothetical protein